LVEVGDNILITERTQRESKLMLDALLRGFHVPGELAMHLLFGELSSFQKAHDAI